jgi:hypothetical protein
MGAFCQKQSQIQPIPLSRNPGTGASNPALTREIHPLLGPIGNQAIVRRLQSSSDQHDDTVPEAHAYRRAEQLTRMPQPQLQRQQGDQPKPKAEAPKAKGDEPKAKDDQPQQKGACVPIVKSFKASATSKAGMAEVNVPQPHCELLLGNPGKSNGMTFASEVEVPAGCKGSLQYVQLIDTCHEIKNSKGEWIHFKTGGEYWLDTQDPYEAKHVDAPGKVEFKTDDSPGQAEGGVHIHVQDKFKMYLLWKPDAPGDAPRVALSMAEWGWSAVADMKKGADPDKSCAERWTVTDPHVSSGTGKALKDTPTWKKAMPKDRAIEKGPC